MLIPLKQFLDKHSIKVRGVIHVGAHLAQEHPEYLKCGIKNMVYIEPCKAPFESLTGMFKINHPNVKLFNCACGEYTGVQEMNITLQGEGQSNSLLAPKLHLKQHPEIKFTAKEMVEVRRIDDLAYNKKDYDMLMMDCQGYEAHVLKGATSLLKGINVVYSEVNKDYVYEGCALIEELDEILKDFDRIETSWAGNTSWGDAVWIRKQFVKENPEEEDVTEQSAHESQTEPTPTQQISESEVFFKDQLPHIYKDNPKIVSQICGLMDSYASTKTKSKLEDVKNTALHRLRVDITNIINEHR